MAELSVRWRYAVAAVASAISATTNGLSNSIQLLGCLSLIVYYIAMGIIDNGIGASGMGWL
jgi:hypothetical protein